MNEQAGFVRTDGRAFLDPAGREVLLNGINLVNKDPAVNYLGPQGPETFQAFEQWGFNCIRFGITWDGLEPEPGVFDEAYLQGVDERIRWADAHGLWVVLDMHQDLYGRKFSNGAPDWATLDDGKPHVKGEIWSDAYLLSPAVQAAFDSFWSNAPAPDGVGVQDHYIAAWKHVASRYAENPTVIGYDIMNEPFMGSGAAPIMPALLGAYARVRSEATGEDPLDEDELMAIWSDEASRLEAQQFIASADTYRTVIDAIADINQAFERTTLSDFYQKVRDVVRTVDTNHILFLEHSYFANTGIHSAIRPVVDPHGNPDPLQAYAPHAYDLHTDTSEVENPSYERVEFIFGRIAETSRRLNLPVLLGEWGAFYSDSPGMVNTSAHAMGLIEQHRFSNTYWSFYADIDRHAYFTRTLVRPHPCMIAGRLSSYAYDINTGAFECTWIEKTDSAAPTMIYIPFLQRVADQDIRLSPASQAFAREPIPSSEAGYLVIPPGGQPQVRTLRVSRENSRVPEKEEE